MYGGEMSDLVPNLPKHWRIEFKNLDTIYTNYDNYEKKAVKDTWTREIDLTLKCRKLEDFTKKVCTILTIVQALIFCIPVS